MKTRPATTVVALLAAAIVGCSDPASEAPEAGAPPSPPPTPELAWEQEGEVIVHMAVTIQSDREPRAELEVELSDELVVRGAFAGDPGNAHPPVHSYTFSVPTDADVLTVSEGSRVVAVADLGDASEVWVDIAYYDPGQVEVSVFDEPVHYG